MTNGLVSVVIPCYNAGNYLPRALRSVAWQTYTRWECIIVDDGSTDNTGEIASAMAAADSRIRYIKKEHSGLAATRNAGIDVARGEYLQFLDADDVLLETKLEECLRAFGADTVAGAMYTDYAYFKPPSEFFRMLPATLPSDDALREFLFGWDVSFLVPVHAFLFRRGVFGDTRFDVNLGSHAEDIDCWIRIAAAGTVFRGIGAPLVVYCISESSTSSQGTALLSTKVRILEKYRTHPACSRLADDFDAAIRLVRQRLAAAHFREKDFRAGREIMAQEWQRADVPARVKMVGWMLLMKVFSMETVAGFRAWVVRATPLRWGAWSRLHAWDAPRSVRELLQMKG